MTIPVSVAVTDAGIDISLTLAERGPTGPIGPAGAIGPEGPVGPEGPSGSVAVSTDVGQLAELGTDGLVLVSSDAVATAAQGGLADSAVQPGDLGTAAAADVGDFATAAQGGLADTAVQPGDLGTAAAADFGDFATAAQGGLADTAVQPGDLGSAALADSGDFATAAQGGLADTAIQPADLATVATTGAYSDLSGTPTIPAAPGDIGAAADDADLAAFTSGAAPSGQVPTADGLGGVDWAAPSGGSGERRYESAYPYDYCGTAPAGTAESATTWALTRITYDAAGSIVATETATDAWDNRATATYA